MDLLAKLKQNYADAHPIEVAQALELLPAKQLAEQLSEFEIKTAAAVGRYLPITQLEQTLSQLKEKNAGKLYAALPIDVQLVLLHGDQDADIEKLLPSLPESRAVLLQRLVSYPPGCAAALIKPAAATVNDDIAVGTALKMLGRNPDRMQFYVYAVDRSQRLTGVVSLRQMLKAKRKQTIDSIMERDVIYLRATTAHGEVLDHPAWQQFHQLPVVDDDQLFLGVISYETWRREVATSSQDRQDSMVPTLLALGELYWMGLSNAMFGSLHNSRSDEERGEQP